MFETAIRINNIPQTGNLVQQDLKPLVHVRVQESRHSFPTSNGAAACSMEADPAPSLKLLLELLEL